MRKITLIQNNSRLILICLLISCYTSVYAETQLVAIKPSSREVTIAGFSRARSNMLLSSEVDGRVVKVYADIGDHIANKGIFACLDDTFVAIDIESAKNDIAQHQVDIQYFKKQVSRYKKLVAKNSASVSLLDDFERQLNNSRRLKKRVSLRQQRLMETKRRHCIHAHKGWSVTERYVEPGQWVKSGDPLAKVGDYSTLLVPFALSVSELKTLQQQTKLHVYLSNYDLSIPATIERISSAFDEQSHKIRVDLSLHKNLPVHRGGMRVELTLDLPDQFGAWLIAKNALDERFEETWIERADGKRFRVSLLGYSADNQFARITSTKIKVGEQFKVLH